MVEAGLSHVRFLQTDASEISSDVLFDAVVGRYILMFLPDPTSVLRSLALLIRSGGTLAFQEPDWTGFLEDVAPLPLWSAGASLLVETLRRCGTNTHMGNVLSHALREAGLPAPAVRIDCLIGSESWLPDCLHSLRATMMDLGLSLDALGDFDTLQDRLGGEVSAFKVRTPLPNIVSAWSRRP
jgi:hypothetical protein